MKTWCILVIGRNWQACRDAIHRLEQRGPHDVRGGVVYVREEGREPELMYRFVSTHDKMLKWDTRLGWRYIGYRPDFKIEADQL